MSSTSKRPYGHRYTALVYLRRKLPGGDVRLYLKDRRGRQVGFLDVEKGVAAIIASGEYYQWARVDHVWKRRPMPPHGTRARYQRGCVCLPCTTANTLKKRRVST